MRVRLRPAWTPAELAAIGVDPTEEGMALPRPFCELVARFF